VTVLKTLPAEIVGLFILVSAFSTKLFLTEVSDFWLSLVTAIVLFVIMHVRTHLVVETTAKEKPSP